MQHNDIQNYNNLIYNVIKITAWERTTEERKVELAAEDTGRQQQFTTRRPLAVHLGNPRSTCRAL